MIAHSGSRPGLPRPAGAQGRRRRGNDGQFGINRWVRSAAVSGSQGRLGFPGQRAAASRSRTLVRRKMLPMCTFDGALADTAPTHDLLVSQALRGQPEHLLLPVAQHDGGRRLLAGQ